MWTFGGSRLDTFGAVTLLDAYLDLPPKRGDNILIPLSHGAKWVPKFFDQRVVSFGMEIIGKTIPDLESKMDSLKALLGIRTQGVLLNEATSRQALAEVVEVLGLGRNPDPLVAKIVIDFLLADPFFRDLAKTTKLFTIDASPKTFTVVHPGSAEECNSIITLTGPLDHPVITNTTNGVVLQYDDILAAAGNTVTIDCANFTAIDETTANVVGKIVHTGAPAFMVLVPGDNDFSVVDGSATTGTIQFDFYPPYL
jgi:hypothetical protein